MDTPSDQSVSDVVVEKPIDDKTYYPKRSKGQVVLIMMSLCIATFLAALDVSIVTTALPSIARAFNSTSAYIWVGSAYLLATAAGTPIWGKLSDIFGRKPALIAANIIFFVGSLVCALAYSNGMLITARAVQGFGGGGLLVLCNIVIGDLFPEAERGGYYGVLGGVWGIALAIGPVLGGVFSQKVTWRWCFYLNLPLDGLALAILIFFLNIKTPHTPIVQGLLAFDWLGALLVMGGSLMFLFGIEFGGSRFPWDSAATICLIVFGIIAVALFFVVQWKFAKYPIIPVRLFDDRSAVACYVICFFHGLALICGLYYLPLYFQGALGATPILSGVYLLATAVMMAVGAIFGGIIIEKTGNANLPMYIGLPMMILGFGLFIDLNQDHDWAKIIIFQLITGFGIGPIFQAPLIALQSYCAQEDVGTATSSFEFLRNLATSIGVVVGGVIFNNSIKKSAAVLEAALPQDIASLLLNGGGAAVTDMIDELSPAQRAVAHAAYARAMRPIWYYAVAMSTAGLIAALLVRRRALKTEHTDNETGLAAEEANRIRAKVLADQKRAAKLAKKNETSPQTNGATA